MATAHPPNIAFNENQSRHGFAKQSSHHGELVQGPVKHRGRLITGLITLPRSDRFSIAQFIPKTGGRIDVHPGYAQKAQKAARWVLDDAGFPDMGGCLRLTTNISPGSGNGSSTADVVAAIRATARAIGLHISNMHVQNAAWRIEGASDPIALSHRHVAVYGSRNGVVIKKIPAALPDMICLGFDAMPGHAIDTASLIGREGYTDQEAAAFAQILGKAEQGVRKQRLDLLTGAASESARLNQRRVMLPNFDELERVTHEEGGLGVACSHSGTVAASLFDPNVTDLSGRLERLSRRLAIAGCSDIGVFAVGANDRSSLIGASRLLGGDDTEV